MKLVHISQCCVECFNVNIAINFLSLILTISSSLLWAQGEPPQQMTIDGRLYDSESPTNPLLDLNVLVRVQVLNPAKTCILYEESQTINTLISNGYFNIQVGSEQGDPKRSTLDSNNSMLDVFYNRTHSILGKTDSGVTCNYTPSPTEIRYFRFFVTPSSLGSMQQLSPDMEINSVPQAIVAQTLQGLSPQDVFQTSATSTQAKLDHILTTAYSNLLDLLAGTSSAYLQNSSNGSVLPSSPNDPPAPSPGQVWFDSTTHEIKFYNGTSVQNLGTNNDASKLPLAGGTLTGPLTLGASTNFAGFDAVSLGHVTLSSERTLRLGQFTNAQQATLLATPLTPSHAGATWFNSETGKIFYWDGTQEREISEETLESVTSRGASTQTSITLNNQAQVRLADAADGEYVALQAPSTLSANYTLTLPSSTGIANQVLTTDGSGTLGWSFAGAASIANDSLDFDKMSDSLILDASTDISVTGTNVLTITNTGSGDSLRINDQSADSTPFVIDAAGNVGIGTTAPTGHETGTGTLYHQLSGAGSGEVNITSNGSSLSHRGALSFSNSGARVAYIRTEKSATSALDAALAFGTNNGSALSEKMRITQSGNVGIGTTAPSTNLHVRSAGGSSSVGAMLVSDSVDTDYIHLDPNFGLTLNRAPGYINNNFVGGSLIVRTSNSTALDTSAMTIISSGSIGVGTLIPSERLHVVGNLRVQGATDCTLGNGAGGTNCSSDIRLKRNVKTIAHSLFKILSLRGIEFDWNEHTSNPGKHAIGVIAQDVEKYFPTAVIEDPSLGYKKVDYAVLVAPLIEAVKEIHQKLQKIFQTSQELKKEIETLKSKNNALEQRLLKQEKEFKYRLEKLEIPTKKTP